MINLFISLMMGIVYLIGILGAGMLIQGLVYWTTGFSIFNKLNKILFKEVN